MKTSPQVDELQRRLNDNVANATSLHTKLQHEISNCQNEAQKRELLNCWSLARNDEERQQVLDGWQDARTSESPRMLDRLKSWLSSER